MNDKTKCFHCDINDTYAMVHLYNGNVLRLCVTCLDTLDRYIATITIL